MVSIAKGDFLISRGILSSSRTYSCLASQATRFASTKRYIAKRTSTIVIQIGEVRARNSTFLNDWTGAMKRKAMNAVMNATIRGFAENAMP
jgi:hypothetical protein